jgi:TonB family protein
VNGGSQAQDRAAKGRDEPLACLKAVEEDLAFWDDLTGLYNKRLLSNVLDRWWPEIVREYRVVSLIVIDLDGFKDVNDTYGHLVGDEVLKISSQLLRHQFRAKDVVTRYGGDEFVVVLPGVGNHQATILAERAREAITKHRFVVEREDQKLDSSISFSVGIASCPDDGAQGTEILGLADLRLYADKNERHRILHRRWSGWWLLAAAVVFVIAGLSGWVARDRDQSDSLQTPIVEVSAEAAAREQVLIERISELQAQVETLLSERDVAANTPDPAADQRVAEMTARIHELQEELVQIETSTTTRDDVRGTDPEIVQNSTTEPLQTPPIELPMPTATAPPPTATPLPTPVPEVIVPPQLLGVVKPRYPEAGLRMRRECDVRLEVEVDAAGRVIAARPVGDQAGFGFDEEARRAALSAQYIPGTVNGIPKTMTTVVTIHFSLNRN